jgi:hypothetical protein
MTGFIDDKGNLFVEMLKAMYGCVQASLLWHQLLVKVLKGMGFKQCEVDPCVMRLIDNLMVHIIMIYVNDLLLFASKKVVDMILAKLKTRIQVTHRRMGSCDNVISWHATGVWGR